MSVSPAKSCCGIWLNVYWTSGDPLTAVKDQITSNRSPGQGSGTVVPGTVGNACASAGMCWCSQQMSTTGAGPFSTTAARAGSWPSWTGELIGPLIVGSTRR